MMEVQKYYLGFPHWVRGRFRINKVIVWGGGGGGIWRRCNGCKLL